MRKELQGLAGVDWRYQVNDHLDSALDELDRAGPEAFLEALSNRLADIRRAAGNAWAGDVIPVIRAHPAVAVARECPLVDYSASTGARRGHNGDAGLFDLIQGPSRSHTGVGDRPRRGAGDGPTRSLARRSGRSQRLFARLHATPTCRSVRARRMLLANAIDETASRVENPNVLAFACGHLRESEWSQALAQGKIGRFVAADQERRHLMQVAKDYGQRFPAIEVASLSVRDVQRGAASRLGWFDLVYAAGLYDHLDQPQAEALTAKLFGMLNPGGRLLISNFGEGIPETAFLEAVMERSLIWRSRDAVAGFAAAIPAAQILSSKVTADATGACWYLDMRRV